MKDTNFKNVIWGQICGKILKKSKKMIQYKIQDCGYL